MGQKKLVSIVVPVFNETEVIEVFYERMKKVLKSLEFHSHELIFVDDGSKDDSCDKLVKMANSDPNVKIIKKANPEEIPHKYATYSVKELMCEMIAHGSKRKDLKAVIVGGSDIFRNNLLEMGKENIRAVKKQLDLLNIKLRREVVGGRRGRVVICDILQKKVCVKTTGESEFCKVDLD